MTFIEIPGEVVHGARQPDVRREGAVEVGGPWSEVCRKGSAGRRQASAAESCP
jgi:hypothetical protein